MIIAGVALALSPFLNTAYLRYQNIRELEALTSLPVSELPVAETAVPELHSDKPEALFPGTGVLTIPALNIEVKVGYGVEPEDLSKGPGFYPQSQPPDQGNVSIAAHRLTCGDWFRDLDKLNPGDEILLYYRGKLYTYLVDKVFITTSNDWSVIEPTPVPVITLTTCHPPGSRTERLIVRASLVKTGRIDPPRADRNLN